MEGLGTTEKILHNFEGTKLAVSDSNIGHTANAIIFFC